jgi:hypothetical protein
MVNRTYRASTAAKSSTLRRGCTGSRKAAPSALAASAQSNSHVRTWGISDLPQRKGMEGNPKNNLRFTQGSAMNQIRKPMTEIRKKSEVRNPK